MSKIQKIREFVSKKREDEKVYLKWLNSVLLMGVDDKSKAIELANLYENITKAMLEMVFKSCQIDSLALPIARFCFIRLNYKIKNIHKFLLYIDHRLSGHQENLMQESLAHCSFETGKKIEDITLDTFDWEVEFAVVLAKEVKSLKI